MKNRHKNILVAPLNWGLGHATRCIPIIRELEKNNFNPIIASDGMALELLKKEFPHLLTLELPSYKIEYQNDKGSLKWKLLKNIPNIIKAISQEKKLIRKWSNEYNLIGIISDNRPGIYHKKIASVYVTHQLIVLSGITTWLTSKIHQYFIKKFRECWVPDLPKKPNLSGKIGHLKNSCLRIKYVGPLSRFEKKETSKKNDLLVILSGPEPQRTLIEEKLSKELLHFNGKVIFIKGLIEEVQIIEQVQNITFYNFMLTEELEKTLNESDKILSRSGYTTIMDLAKLNKKAFFIPTPGQYEQEYLALKLKENGIFPFAKQEEFRIENLMEIPMYKGLQQISHKTDWENLFVLFQSE